MRWIFFCYFQFLFSWELERSYRSFFKGSRCLFGGSDIIEGIAVPPMDGFDMTFARIVYTGYLLGVGTWQEKCTPKNTQTFDTHTQNRYGMYALIWHTCETYIYKHGCMRKCTSTAITQHGYENEVYMACFFNLFYISSATIYFKN